MPLSLCSQINRCLIFNQPCSSHGGGRNSPLLAGKLQNKRERRGGSERPGISICSQHKQRPRKGAWGGGGTPSLMRTLHYRVCEGLSLQAPCRTQMIICSQSREGLPGNGVLLSQGRHSPHVFCPQRENCLFAGSVPRQSQGAPGQGCPLMRLSGGKV